MQLLRLFSIASFIFSILLYPFNSVMYAGTYNWQPVASTSMDVQSIDTSSIKYKKGILYTLVRHSELNQENGEVISTNTYELKIDCEKRLFKQGEKWERPEGKLMKETIINSCSY